MTLESIINWLETTAFHNFCMVALASSLLGLVGLGLSVTLRRRSAAVRFSVWQLVTCGVVLSTLLILTVHGVALGRFVSPTQTDFGVQRPLEMSSVPFINEAFISEDDATPFLEERSASKERQTKMRRAEGELAKAFPSVAIRDGIQSPTSTESINISPAAIIGIAWIFFAIGMSLGVVKSAIHAWVIVHRAKLPVSEHFFACLQSAMCQVGIDSGFRVKLVQTDQLSVPFTIGLLRPTVVIPDEANAWSTEKLVMVLAHELAHVKRRDILWHWISRVACCFAGFNPLTWLVVRRSAIERENACDDCVIEAGFDAADYGQSLLEIAAAMSGRRVPLIGISMAQPPLRQRLKTVLTAETDRRPVSARTLTALSVMFALLAGVTGIIRPLEKRVAAHETAASLPTVNQPQIAKAEPAEITEDDDTSGDVFITGTITDLDARPIAHATVELHHREFTEAGPYYPEIFVSAWKTETDDDGNYKVNVGPAPEFSDNTVFGVAYAFAHDFALKGGRDWKKLSEVRKGKSISPTKLQPGHFVRGRVLDSDGNPISGMIKGAGTGGEVNDMWWMTLGHVVGGDGKFTISVPDNYQIELMAYAKSHAPQPITLSKDDTDCGDIKLTKGTTVKGVLLDRKGKPVSGVVIAMEGTGGKLPGIGFDERYAVLTDETGRFEFPPSSGQCSVRATDEANASNFAGQKTIGGGLPPAILPVVLNLLDEGEAIELVLRETETVTVSGIARWENGEPVENLLVRFSGVTETDGRRGGGEIARTETDAQGRYSLTVPAPLNSAAVDAFGTKNADGVWLPAQGECKAATSDGSQVMSFEPLTKDITNANWVVKPWPNLQPRSKLQLKADRELEELKKKEEALAEDFRNTKQNIRIGVDQDPHAMDPRNTMAYEYLTFERENRGEDAALKALSFVMKNASQLNSYYGAAGQARNEAVGRLISHYREHKDLADTFFYLDNETTVPHGDRLLTRAVQYSPHPHVVAAALYVQATRINETMRDVEMLPQMTTILENKFLPDAAQVALADRLERLRIANVDELRQTADKLLTRLTTEFGDMDFRRNPSTFGEQATALRFAINEVRAGAQVPEMDVKDVEGKPFRFADYQGKYIVLTFCHVDDHSRVQADHHNLKDTLPDLPLHFVTVCRGNPETEMTDEPRGNLGTLIREGYWGPMATAWAHTGTPGIYVIDTDGILQPQINEMMGSRGTAAHVIRELAERH